METRLITYFTGQEIEDIKNHLANYAINIYEENTILQADNKLFNKYMKAKKLLTKKIDADNNEIKEYLDEMQSRFYDNVLQNKMIASMVSGFVEDYFVEEAKKYCSHDIEKLNFLFDFVTSYYNYANDYRDYNSLVPSKFGIYEFDFRGNLPVAHDVSQSLAYHQEVCEGISWEMQHLGNLIGLDIKAIPVINDSINHSINYLVYEGTPTLIDATKKIQKKLKKENCFLVGRDKLLKNGNYEFNGQNNIETYTIDNPTIMPYNMNDIIKELVNKIPVKVEYIDYEEKENRR